MLYLPARVLRYDYYVGADASHGASRVSALQWAFFCVLFGV